MKKLQILLLGMLCLTVFTACEKDAPRPDYKITTDAANVTFDKEGKATTSCTVNPADLDISKIQLEYSSVKQSSDDEPWSGVNITSVTKDPKTAGKWNIAFQLFSKGNPYAPKPECFYYLKATVGVFMQMPSDGFPVHSNKFEILVDITGKN